MSPPDPSLLTPALAAGLDRLRDGLRALGHVVVAYSGGIDSTLLLRVAVEVLGERAVGLTARSASYPPWELEEARALARDMGARVIEVETREMERAGYRANAGDRCYHCKSELFEVAAVEAARLGLENLCYGAIPDDLGDHRPGMNAARERGVRAPLIEVGLGKAEIRVLARAYGLPNWDKPAAACLSSRFPYGTSIDPARLAKVTRAEAALRALGLRRFRARFHDDLVRVELGADELPRVFADAGLRAAISAGCKAAGFKWVALDLDGYRTGSANEALAPPLVRIEG